MWPKFRHWAFCYKKIYEFSKQEVGVTQVQNDKLFMEPLVEHAQQI